MEKVGGSWRLVLALVAAMATGVSALAQDPPKAKTPEEQKAEREAAKKKEAEEAKKRRKEYAGKVDFEVNFPRGNEISLKGVNAPVFRFEIRITNRNDLPVVIAPFFRLSLLDEQGEAIETSVKKARFAPPVPVKKKAKKKDEPEVPEEPEEKPDPADKLPWIEIEPGQTRVVSCSIREFRHDIESEYGWKLEQPGDITFHVEHAYSKDGFVRKMTRHGSKKEFDNELDPWSRALELNRTFSAAIRVTP